jgi:hypothetical protein
MYGVLYAISPEIFPAKDRGTGNGLVSSATRVFSIIAPIIALYANLETATPVYISGALIILAGFLALLLPYEPRGRASIWAIVSEREDAGVPSFSSLSWIIAQCFLNAPYFMDDYEMMKRIQGNFFFSDDGR